MHGRRRIARQVAEAVCLLVVCACFSRAQSNPAPTTIRYHFGDDLRWADPGFDDSAWPVAELGRWPAPSFYSDGFVWVRLRLPVRSDAGEGLAIRAMGPSSFSADEFFVNGALV